MTSAVFSHENNGTFPYSRAGVESLVVSVNQIVSKNQVLKTRVDAPSLVGI